MALLTESGVRALARRAELVKSAESTRRADAQTSQGSYDIFLSHAFRDREVILGTKRYIQDMGYSVYVDWIDDRSLDRGAVTTYTATVLKTRMKNCKCLLFATSENSEESKWMPWELGFKDGQNGLVAILPIVRNENAPYRGQEYLGIYPYIDICEGRLDGRVRLWVNDASDSYVDLDSWLKGKAPTKR